MSMPKLPDDLRNMLPLTPAVFFILLALAEGEKHGYAIMQDVTGLSSGEVKMGPGTLYTTIQRFLEIALIEETRNDESERRRRYYRLTRAGKLLLEAEVARMEEVVHMARRRKLVPDAK
jgi:DNA-binding PadR family transcriptional regulator